MWFLPLLVLSAIVVAAASRSPREAAPPSRQLVPAAAPPPPGPISVLGEYVRIGQIPPPPVILCAVAEAEAIGREDLASDIIKVFVAPVVFEQMPMPMSAPYAQSSQSGRGERRSAASCSPREVLYTPSGVVPRPPGPSTQLLPPEANYPGMDPHYAAKVRHALAAREAPSPVAVQIPATDDEIRAMLNADPEKFLAMATRGMPVVEAPIVHAMPSTPPKIDDMDASPSTQVVEPVGLPTETVAQMQEDAGLHGAADQTRAMAPGSPIATVSDGAWRDFVRRLARETPLFSSSRHVGQYRQRRERLGDLGIDPEALLGSAQAQRAALDADLIDALRHAADGELLQHVGRSVAIPGHDAPEKISLSGVLGVIQCAGLDGAVGWLERPGDRKRYPHTTQAFSNTNGVF